MGSAADCPKVNNKLLNVAQAIIMSQRKFKWMESYLLIKRQFWELRKNKSQKQKNQKCIFSKIKYRHVFCQDCHEIQIVPANANAFICYSCDLTQ